MKKETIEANVCKALVMTGVYYKNHHPGGISSVIQSWSEHFEELHFYPMFKETNNAGKLYYFLKSIIALFFKFLIDKRVKIVYIHTAADHDFWRSGKVIQLAKLFDKKIVLHSHASRFKDFYNESSTDKQAWIKKTIGKADLLIVLSESWKEWFCSIGIESTKIKILHNITPYPKETGLASQSESTQGRNRLNLLFLGEIGQRKGIFDLLEAIIDHRRELKDKIELRIGGNKNEKKLLEVIAKGGIEGFVHFEGYVVAEKKIELLNWADVFILPSHNEGLPISILEAMSYRMPIISTPVGGIPEVVDETNGILVKPGDKEELFNAVYHYVYCHVDIDKHGKKSYEKVQPYLPNGVISELKMILKELIN